MEKTFLGKIKLVDIIIVLGVIIALVTGFFTYNHFRQTADKQVKRTAKVAFQVFLRGVTLTGGINPIKADETTYISIRNIPYTNLKVIDSSIDTKKIVMPSSKGKVPFTIVEDFSKMFMYDILVTIIDDAQITEDGAVIGGNKIKMGLPITLEGKDYKFNGTVSSVQVLTDKQLKQIKQQIAKARLEASKKQVSNSKRTKALTTNAKSSTSAKK